MLYGGSTSTTGDYGYDAAGRVLRKIQRIDSTDYLVEASYNVSAATTMTYPSVPGYSDRRVATPSFDYIGRVQSLSSSATSYAEAASVSSVSYASHGAPASETYGNNLVHQIGYEPKRLQVNDIKLGTSGSPTSIAEITYSYGTTANNGNLQSTSYSGGGLSYTQSFSYDSLNRLDTATETTGSTTNWSQSNSYDRYGNRAIIISGTPTPSFSSSTNRITGLSYDSSGNVTNDGVHTYLYDSENHILKVDGTAQYVCPSASSAMTIRVLLPRLARWS